MKHIKYRHLNKTFLDEYGVRYYCSINMYKYLKNKTMGYAWYLSLFRVWNKDGLY